MKKLGLLLIVLALSIPLCGYAQEVEDEDEDFETYVARLNAECPIQSGEHWTLLSFAEAGDIVVVELQIPASLGPFMSVLTDNTDNVRRLWVREMEIFGEIWEDFVARLVKEDRPMRLSFKPKGSDTSARILLKPSDFKKK